MSVETSEKKEICKVCGADVRPGTMFCYNCGSPIAPELPPANGSGKNEFNKSNFQTAGESISKPDVKIESGKPIEKPFSEPIITKDKAAEFGKPTARDKKLVVEKETVLKTAAAVRRQPKPPSKSVEVIWEKENSANILFIVAAVVLTLFAVGALMLMIHLR